MSDIKPNLETEKDSESDFSNNTASSTSESEDNDSDQDEIIFTKPSALKSSKNSISDQKEQDTRPLAESLSNMESEFINFRANIENEIYAMHDSFQGLSNLEDKVVRLENKIKSNNVDIDNRIYNVEIQSDNILKSVQELSSQVKKLNEQRKQMLNQHSQMKNEIDQLKSENTSLKQELFVLKEITTKHESAFESHINFVNETQASQSLTPDTGVSANMKQLTLQSLIKALRIKHKTMLP